MAWDIVISIVAKIGEYLVAPIGHQLGYLLCYKCNIEDFKKQVEKLELVRATLQMRVDVAERNGEVILPDVQTWLTSVNEITEESRNLLNDDKGCFNGHCLCLDLKLRYQRSRKAKKKTVVANELKRDGKFKIISCPAPPPGIVSTEDAEVFESRKSTSKEIMEALKDDHINMIGIYGMGGVGKTTLVKEVGKQAKDDNLFDEVVIAVVSETANLRRIQDEIADMLGLKFDAASDSGRARELFARLTDEKRKLVILDDIWDRVELERIRIPFGAQHKSCKILFTSRRLDVCEQMNTQKNFPIKVLLEEEAWNLFRKMAGDSVDSSDLHLLAVEVAKECAGLPLAIVTVARALTNRSRSYWSDTANQLRHSDPSKRVVESLELSYNYLATEEAKSFFLLCCLFPEDHDIAIQDLLKYGMGLGLFKGVDTVDQARERAHRLAEDLKSSCLLLESSKKECVKMHDVVRDVAISIASKGKHVFLVRAGQGWKGWPKQDTFKRYTAISLMSDDIHDELPDDIPDDIPDELPDGIHDELPDGLECPKLQTLLLGCSRPSLQFPNNFFLRMKNLKVLNLSRMRFSSLPPSLRYLKSLQTLCIHRCSLKDISIIGELKKLEILSFLGSEIKELPKEIGTLTQLRLLDLTECEELKIIPPDVIRGLSRLEGLYMEGSFEEWENIERQDKERSNASLAELKHLSRLTTLEIHISDANLLPDDLLFEKLLRFKISIGTRFADCDHYSYSKILKLKLNVSTPLKDGVNVLLKKAEDLHLDEMKGLKSVLYDLDREGFQNLRCLNVRKCDEVEYIFNATRHVSHDAFPILEKLDLSDLANLKEICHGQLTFRNLRVVKVEDCGKLKNLFSHSIAKDLSKLIKLKVIRCEIMEEIFGNEKEEAAAAMDNIVFPHLRSLKLEDLPNLRNFCSQMKCLALKGDLDTHTEEPFFDKKVAFPNLEKLYIYKCDSLRHVFSPSVARGLVQLQRLEIKWCEMMKEIIAEQREGEDEAIGNIAFPQLHTLRLNSLQNLTTFCRGSYILDFASLVTLSIRLCNKIKAIAASGCRLIIEELETNIDEGQEETECDLGIPVQPLFNEKVAFPNLEKLDIILCDSLRHVFSPSVARGLVQLQRLQIFSCKMMKEIIAEQREGEDEAIGNIAFPQLHTLELEYLPNLTTFCRGSYILDFESLVTLRIGGCDNITAIAAFGCRLITEKLETNIDEGQEETERDLGIPVQPLFNEKVAFPNLEKLHINGCDNLRDVFSSPSVARGLVQLQILEIIWCKMMKEIIAEQREGEDEAIGKIAFPQLHTLKLEALPHLTTFCRGSYILDFPSLVTLNILACDKIKAFATSGCRPITEKLETNDEGQEETERDLGIPIQPLFNEKVAFPNLEKLRITSCDNLRNVFSSPSVARGLVQLQRLEIGECEMMKEIIAEQREGEDEAIGKIAFPQLHTLELQNLPNLTTFCQGLITQKLETNIDEGKEETERDLGIPIQPLFNEKVTFPTLKELTIEGVDNLKDIWHPQLPAESFGQLRVLEVKSCRKLLNVVPSYSLKGLKNLEEVSVAECDLVEIIFEIEELADKGKHGTGTLLSKLKKLELRKLPMLFTSKHPFLQKLKMNDEEFEEKPEEGSSSITIRPLFNEWVTFPTLEELTIEGLDNLKDIWHPQLPAESFGQLRVLKVKSCRKLLNVVPSYSLKGLKNLEEVSVAKCDLVEIIFEIEELADKGKHGTGTLLSKLRKLELSGLPKLLTSKPEEGSSSFTIRPLFNEWVTFPTLEELTIEGIDNLKDIWHPQLPPEYFGQLRVLKVKSCHKLLNVVPSYSLKGLKNLEEVSVAECDLVEIIFEIEELAVKGKHGTGTLLSKLRKLELSGLPKLLTSKHPFLQKLKMNDLEFEEKPEEGSSSIPIRPLFNEWAAFTNLEDLRISNIENLQEIFHSQLPADSFCQVRILEVTECDKLLRVAPSNLLPRLKNLEKLVVKKCNSMEKIFEVEGPVGDGHAAISLFQLNDLELRSLPKLGIFCSGNYNFELPSLYLLVLWDCPKMQTFSSGFISSPQLNDVRVENYESLWKGDLNSTVQHLFQEKGKLKSDISNGREVEEEEGGEKVNKKFDEADKVEEDVERGENVSAPAIQHEISELAEEEA